jgi:hypothetical protein
LKEAPDLFDLLSCCGEHGDDAVSLGFQRDVMPKLCELEDHDQWRLSGMILACGSLTEAVCC